MLLNILYGLIIGIGLILPGVSGGVIAVILNIYDKLVYSLNNLFKKPKESIKLLFPILIGALIGMFLIGKLIKFLLFDKGYYQIYFLFIGLILGSIPKLIQKTKEKGKLNYVLITISFVLSILLFIFGKDIINLSITNKTGTQSFIFLFITGIIFSLGKIVPGISSSFLLMLVGTYEYFINLLTNPLKIFNENFLNILFLVLGILVGVFIFIKLMNHLLKKHYCSTYSIIIGFVIGSVYAIYPGITFNLEGIISILILIFSFIFSYNISKINKK